MKQCPYCNAQMADESKFCGECGKEYPQGNTCPHCGARVYDGDVFCENCGSNLTDNSFADDSLINKQIQKDDEESRSNWIPYILGAIGLLAICVGGWWFLKNRNTNEPFETSLVSFKKTAPSDNFDLTAEINIDYPQKGNSKLKDNVIDFILKALKEDFTFEEPSQNPTYEGDKYDGQAVVDFYGEAKIKEFQKEGVGEVTFNVMKDAEMEKFISYRIDMGGSIGGTGIGLSYGMSFNKSDGSIIQVIKDSRESGFKDFLKSYVKSYLKKEGGLELLDESELNAHPYPNKAPYLTKDGICFIYQKYEIGPGVMGEVEFVIPYSEIRPYMSDAALSVVDAAEIEEQNEEIERGESISTEQEIQAKKDFIESFYKGMESSNNIDDYVKKNVTDNAKRILIEEFDYECDGECLATWLFDSEAGSDIGPFVSRTINVKNEDNFLVVTKYVDAEYEVRLSVIKVGDSYKIDDIEKVRATYEAATTDSSNNYSEDSYNSSNGSTLSRTFYDEQIVIGYLANQSFRSNDGLTMRVDGDGRLYVDGDYAGVLSVLRYTSTSALLRYGGGLYGEGNLSVLIVGDKFQLTDPTDGTVYYQR